MTAPIRKSDLFRVLSEEGFLKKAYPRQGSKDQSQDLRHDLFQGEGYQDKREHRDNGPCYKGHEGFQV